MGSLQSVSEYFKGKDVPNVHPFQDVPKSNYCCEKNKALEGEGQQPFGYEKNKRINTSKDHKSLKVKK